MPKRPLHIRKQFFDVQDRRCPVCDLEIPYGAPIYFDKLSGLVLCQKCWSLITHMRRKRGLILDRANKLVRENAL